MTDGEAAKAFKSQGRQAALQKTGNSHIKPTQTGSRLSMGRTAHAYDEGGEGGEVSQSGTSIFDPVLCELVYRWFCIPGGFVLDPFAGGSVRGIVAARLGFEYVGIDLRPEQVEANRKQAERITPDKGPVWIVGDSQNVKTLAPGSYDLVFSCPPYFDLELYSDDPADISNAGDYATFLKVYRAIIAASVSMLKDNRFACFVVGDIRDRKGFYRNFVSDTIAAFQDAGVTLYNEAILVTAVGSLPIRVGRQFQSGRKLGKTHQNVLVFYKGDPKTIGAFGDVECGDDVQALNEAVSAGEDMVPVKLSAKMLRLRFNGCEPSYIATVCHARCCESSTRESGTLITINPAEQERIEGLGGVVVDGLLQARPGEKRCPFKSKDDLCSIHFGGGEPFGCIASPFTLNDHDTLIVRNRYRLLKCYNDGNRKQAYHAFRESLVLLFGEAETQKITDHMDGGGGDYTLSMARGVYEMLKVNDAIKHGHQ